MIFLTGLTIYHLFNREAGPVKVIFGAVVHFLLVVCFHGWVTWLVRKSAARERVAHKKYHEEWNKKKNGKHE